MWWWWWVAIWVILLFFFVLMPFGWGYRRWGRPTYHYHYRRGAHRDLDPAYRDADQPYDDLDRYDAGAGWAWWTYILWAILIGLLIWAAAAVWWY